LSQEGQPAYPNARAYIAKWADEAIYDWGVLEYPDMEAYQKKVEELEKLEWWRCFSAKTILDTKMEV
jgi:hypothetical protein